MVVFRHEIRHNDVFRGEQRVIAPYIPKKTAILILVNVVVAPVSIH